MFGRERVKPYQSEGTPMYFAVASHKPKYAVKIVTVLPEEKVRRVDPNRESWGPTHQFCLPNDVVACYHSDWYRQG